MESTPEKEGGPNTLYMKYDFNYSIMQRVLSRNRSHINGEKEKNINQELL